MGISEAVGSFSFLEGLFLRAAKHHLHGWYSLAYIFERRSQKNILSAIVQIHRPNCKAMNAALLSLHFEQIFYRQLLNSGDPLQWRCLNKDLVVVLSSLHTNRYKLKGSEDFNWNNIGLASLWFVWFCRHAWFRLMISCRLVIRTC